MICAAWDQFSNGQPPPKGAEEIVKEVEAGRAMAWDRQPLNLDYGPKAHRLALFRDRIWTFGGLKYDNGSYVSTRTACDLHDGKCLEYDPALLYLSGFGLHALPDRLIAFGGFTREGSPGGPQRYQRNLEVYQSTSPPRWETHVEQAQGYEHFDAAIIPFGDHVWSIGGMTLRDGGGFGGSPLPATSVLRTRDFMQWELVDATGPDLAGRLRGFVFRGQMYVYSDRAMARSSDGKSWERVETAGTGLMWWSMAFPHNDQLVLVSTRDQRAVWTGDFVRWKAMGVYDLMPVYGPPADNFLVSGNELVSYSGYFDESEASKAVRKLKLDFITP